jgi:uncharacterized protein (TIGR03437 family)
VYEFRFRYAILAPVLVTRLLAQLPELELAIRGLDRPTAIAVPHDGSGRIFVGLQTGAIAVYSGSADKQASPVPVLSLPVACCAEQGLLGLTFHPRFRSNGYFFVNYTREGDGVTVVERYRLSPPSANVADPGTRRTILIIEQPGVQHNGGDLKFGPDGYLYISVGEGGLMVPPLFTAQDPDSLLGKILRIDVERGNPYAVPTENASGSEVYAMGLRNPWRFSFDRQTGDLVVGDVGWGDREEINVIPKGVDRVLNFGWPYLEAEMCHTNCDAKGLIPPVLVHGHLGENGASSITGGFTYRGSKYRQFLGRYFYGDFVSGRLWLVDAIGPIGPLHTGLAISTFGEDEEGELLLADYNSGSIYRIISSSAMEPQRPTVGAVVNGATFADDAPIAPGSIVTLFASNLGSEANLALFPTTEFAGVSVFINGQPAPLFAVAPASGQINLLAPNTLPDSGVASVVVRNGDLTSNAFGAPLSAVAPGIFPIFDPSSPGRVYAAATLAGTAWVTTSNATSLALGIPTDCEANGVPAWAVCGRPAKPGDLIQLFVTGLGEATSNGLAGGPALGPAEAAPADGSTLYRTVETPRATIGGIDGQVIFSGLAPGFAGLYQLNVLLPSDAPAGDAVPLTVASASGESDSKVIAIRP